jgi:mRNA-decapping enzyme subunit 2
MCFHVHLTVNERDFLEATLNSHKMKLYIAAGVPEYTQFVTQTVKEISRIEWFSVDELPVCKGNGSSNFFLVIPFVRQLQEWIK